MGHRDKLNRAKEHLDSFQRESIDWFKNYPQPLVEVEAEDLEHTLIYARDDFPSERLGVLIGDIVQNLRQALDHLAYSLADFHSPTMTDRERESSEFPVFWSRSGWPDAKTKKIGRLCPCAQAEIERLQPFNAGDPGYKTRSLWQLHELSRIDKHRLLLTTLLRSWPGSVISRGVQWGSFEVYEQPLKRGAKIAAFTFRGTDPQVHVNFNVTFDIAFADGPLKGKGVQLALAQLESEIERDVVAVLEPFLLAHNHIVQPVS